MITHFQERASIVQREMSDTVARMRPERARTLATFEQGRTKQARLAGYQIPYWKDRANGQTLYNPLAGDYSFRPSTKQKTGAMFVGVIFRAMNITLESTILRDMKRGYIPDSYIKERRRRIDTHMWKKNWAAIGDGTAAVAAVSSASGSTITCLANNSARGTSKGVYRLQVSDSSDPLLYDCIDPSDDSLKATFYITAKPSTTTATATFTVGNAAAMNANTYKICETGQWKKELTGIAGHISDSTSRIYQLADVSVDDFLQNPSVDAGNAAVTPTSVFTAKKAIQGRCNSDEELPFLAHISIANYADLAKFGYTARTYDAAESPSGAMKTLGLPRLFEDGDTVWVQDADYEDGYIDFRERSPFFEYTHKDFGLDDTADGISRFAWPGLYGRGSTVQYENYTEGVQIVWDSRGKDGDGEGGGNPNTSVFIKNIAISSQAQYALGV